MRNIGRIGAAAVVIGAVFIIAFRVLAPHSDDTPTVAAAWTALEGSDGTTCALQTPYRFFARQGIDARRVAVFFQPGGGCWSAETCGSDTVLYDESVAADEPLRYDGDGIFDFGSAENPLGSFDMLFVSYCTADVHVGDTQRIYRPASGASISIRHSGYDNARAALDWLFAAYPTLDQVAILGSSAGALGALYHAGAILERYPDAQATVFSDSYVGVIPNRWQALADWNAGENLPPYISGRTLDTFTVERMYMDTAQAFPQATFALYTQAADAFQISFYAMSGGAAFTWARQRQAILDAITQQPNIRAYMSSGVLHTALTADRFYTIRVGETRLRDWLADALAGRALANVSCQVGALGCP
jgi:hypothetical protein